jgi:hypothetical protein
MQLSNLQAAILAIVMIAFLAFVGWTIREKSKPHSDFLPEFIQGATKR